MTEETPILTRWRALWTRLGCPSPRVMHPGGQLVAAYQKPQRFYHTKEHLLDVLEKLDWAKTALEATGELAGMNAEQKQRLFDTVELALWYHDAVYDPKAHDNEAKSRDLFLKHAEEFNLPEDLRRDVAALIDLTARHKDAKTLPESLMVDCDLAILGAPDAAFAAYDENIRKEYAHVPGPAYKRARKSVLKSFLDQPAIFRTKAFATEYEAKARQNLDRATNPPVSWKWGGFRR